MQEKDWTVLLTWVPESTRFLEKAFLTSRIE